MAVLTVGKELALTEAGNFRVTSSVFYRLVPSFALCACGSTLLYRKKFGACMYKRRRMIVSAKFGSNVYM